MDNQSEIEKIQQAIDTLNAQRQTLGDQVVETALAPLKERLVSMQSSMSGEGRKLITVLFADLADHTTLFARLDAEDVRELLNAYFIRWREIIERYSGVVEKFIGDAVMAVFGLTASHEDDPERAIRAALEMVQALEKLNLDKELAPGMRVGINTGEAVVSSLGERQGEDFVVVGETVNLASRLQAAAPVGGILITHDTYRHVRGVFDVQPVEALQLKGIPEPVQAYLVKAAKPRAFRLGEREVEGIETHLVGRDAEHKRLQDAFYEVIEDRQQQVVTLVGEAGIGKSRLISEFEVWLDLLPRQIYYFKGRAHPSLQNVPYSLTRDVFAFRFQIQDSDPPEVVREKLEQGYTRAFTTPYVEGVGMGQTPPDMRAAHFLGRLLGFEFGPSEHIHRADVDARGFHGEALVYLGNYFRAIAQYNPIVVLLEDLHWADDSSLDLIHYLEGALTNQPILIVCATRPSLFERRPFWGEGLPFHTRLELRPLSKRDSRNLIEQILYKVQDLPGELRELVVSTAEGNPFYIEELLKMLIEDRVILPGDPFWQVQVDRLADVRVPPTLVGVLQARFDSLSPEQRSCLQRGSVIGRTFWDQAIEYMGGGTTLGADSEQPPTSQILDLLRAREMIFKLEHSTFEETNEYIFKHALLRDVTYESLLKRQRRGYHHLAAGWLEEVTERVQRSDELAALIAAHYEQASEITVAAEWYWRAGRGAAARYASAEAVYAFTKALQLLPAEDESRQFEILLAREKMFALQGAQELRDLDLVALQTLADRLADPARSAQVALQKAAYHFSLSDFPAVIAKAQKAGELAQVSQNIDILAEAYLLQAAAMIRQGSFDPALENARRALDLAERHAIPVVQANTLRQLGLISYYNGYPQEAYDSFQAALRVYIEIGDRQGEGMALNNLGGASFDLGNYREAGSYYARSLQLCGDIGDRLGEGRALNNLGIISVVNADYSQAEDYYLKSLQIQRELGQRSFEASSLDNLGNLSLYRYQYTQSQKYQQEALSIIQQIGDRVGESIQLLNLSRGHLAIGDYENAYRDIQASLSLSHELNNLKDYCQALVNLGHYYLETGDADAALTQAQEALDIAREQGLLSEQAWAQNVLADVLLVLNQDAEAIEHYRAALETRRTLDESHEKIGTQAGLAEAFMKIGDLDAAQVQVEDILDYFQGHDIFGFEQPIRVMLICYRVLSATQDPRASAILEQGYTLLQECAHNIEDESLRRSFLERVPANRDLQAAWVVAQRRT